MRLFLLRKTRISYRGCAHPCQTERRLHISRIFTSDSIIRIDTEGRTEGTYCGVQFGWLPTALVPDHTAYLYNVIANRNPEQLDGVSDSQIEMAKDCVYSTDSTSQVNIHSAACLPMRL